MERMQEVGFRTNVFGGFNRNDVLEHIKGVYYELWLCREENDALRERCEALEAQLQAAGSTSGPQEGTPLPAPAKTVATEPMPQAERSIPMSETVQVPLSALNTAEAAEVVQIPQSAPDTAAAEPPASTPNAAEVVQTPLSELDTAETVLVTPAPETAQEAQVPLIMGLDAAEQELQQELNVAEQELQQELDTLESMLVQASKAQSEPELQAEIHTPEPEPQAEAHTPEPEPQAEVHTPEPELQAEIHTPAPALEQEQKPALAPTPQPMPSTPKMQARPVEARRQQPTRVKVHKKRP